MIPGPSACSCCGGALSKLGETITETLEVVPRQWKVIQTVRERFACRACESICEPPAPFHPIARGHAGPQLLAMILEAKFGQHLPLNRQSTTFAQEGITLDVSTLADWVGACTATLAPLAELIRAHVMAAERLHGDDGSHRACAMGARHAGPRAGQGQDGHGPALDLCPRRQALRRAAPPAALFYYSPDRTGVHPRRHLAGYGGISGSHRACAMGPDAGRRVCRVQ